MVIKKETLQEIINFFNNGGLVNSGLSYEAVHLIIEATMAEIETINTVMVQNEATRKNNEERSEQTNG